MNRHAVGTPCAGLGGALIAVLTGVPGAIDLGAQRNVVKYP
jgi:hypothetical protein